MYHSQHTHYHDIMDFTYMAPFWCLKSCELKPLSAYKATAHNRAILLDDNALVLHAYAGVEQEELECGNDEMKVDFNVWFRDVVRFVYGRWLAHYLHLDSCNIPNIHDMVRQHNNKLCG